MDINKKRTKPIRAAPDFEDIIKNVKLKNMKRGKEVRTSRITLAISRQYKKYPELLKELEDADLI